MKTGKARDRVWERRTEIRRGGEAIWNNDTQRVRKGEKEQKAEAELKIKERGKRRV